MRLIINCLLLGLIEAVKETHFIHWNTSNPIFRIDNTDHIIDVNRDNKPWEYDQVNIICPVYKPGENSNREKSVIYSVSKDEYETCRITQHNPRVIAICDKPHELMYFTITFRSFTPTPGGMEFTPGKDYYFITTSSGSDLYQRVGGRCSTHHMKVAFKVADNVQHQTPKPATKVVNVPRYHPLYPPGHQDPKGGLFMNRQNTAGKKREEESDDSLRSHPNDVIKHEASRLASISSGSSQIPECAILLALTAALLKLFGAATDIL